MECTNCKKRLNRKDWYDVGIDEQKLMCTKCAREVIGECTRCDKKLTRMNQIHTCRSTK